MKRIVGATFLAAIFISIGSVCARAQAFEVRIPFNFIVNDHVLPSGTYLVGYLGAFDRRTIKIRSLDGRFGAASWTSPISDQGYPGTAELIFVRYGNQHFLNRVICEDVSMHAELPVSKMEKQARIQIAEPAQGGITIAALGVGEK